MPNYKKMYLSLFKDVTDTIESLKLAQQKAEEICMGGKGAASNIEPSATGDKETAAE